MKFVGEILKAIGDAFLKIGASKQGQQSLKALGDVASKVLIPAFAQFATNMGKVIVAIGQFLAAHPKVASEMKDFITIFLTVGAALKIFGALISPVAKLVGLVASLAKVAEAFKTAVKLTGLSKFFSDEKGGVGGGKGTLTVVANGAKLAAMEITPDDSDVMRQIDLKSQIKPGANNIELEYSGEGSVMYQIVGRYYIP